MQGLEKILEEIGELRGQAGSECTSEDHYIKKAWEHCLDRVVGIIRKHMNDGWLPVEECLPEEEKEVLVTTDTGEITFGYISDGEWNTDLEPDYPIAWRPLPEPYRVERSGE